MDDREAQAAVDGGDGGASVDLDKTGASTVKAMAKRLASDASSNPVTGADLGAGPGAGTTTPVQ